MGIPRKLSIGDSMVIDTKEFVFTFSRSPGPGGQNVNKVNSKAILKWNVRETASLPEGVRARLIQLAGKRIDQFGELTIVSHRFRNQSRNVADCLDRLRDWLERAAKPATRRRPTRPSRAARVRRLESKRRQGLKKSARRRRHDESA